jgi:hypothetical protein
VINNDINDALIIMTKNTICNPIAVIASTPPHINTSMTSGEDETTKPDICFIMGVRAA